MKKDQRVSSWSPKASTTRHLPYIEVPLLPGTIMLATDFHLEFVRNEDNYQLLTNPPSTKYAPQHSSQNRSLQDGDVVTIISSHVQENGDVFFLGLSVKGIANYLFGPEYLIIAGSEDDYFDFSRM